MWYNRVIKKGGNAMDKLIFASSTFMIVIDALDDTGDKAHVITHDKKSWCKIR